MFPISITQLKLLNFFKLHKIITWTLLRKFQLENTHNYKSIYLVNKKNIENYLIGKPCQTVFTRVADFQSVATSQKIKKN